MIFNSLEFLFFLPIAFMLYWFACRKSCWQNAFLLLSSLAFYGWWNWKLLGLIVAIVAVTYVGGILIERTSSRKAAKAICATVVTLCLLNLGVFKYYDFFADNLVGILNKFGMDASFTTLNLVLPIGISFYTLQAVSYVIDVYRGSIRASHSPVDYATYISFFPQLVAGPIERAGTILPQFAATRRFDYAMAVDGLRQALWGFFKKLAIADNCGHIVDQIFADYHSYGTATLAFGAVLFTIQIYTDFSGYSDIAIGVAKLFGIRLSRNFDNPYFAIDIPQFWRRWHMSLMSWFRDYLYIPLGGNRRGKARQVLNVGIVFLVSGLWHGANWTFVAWGGYNALLFIPYIITRHRTNDSTFLRRLVGRIVTFLLVVIGFTIFRADSIADAGNYFVCMFTNPCLSISDFSLTICIYTSVALLIEWIGRNGSHAIAFVADIKSSLWRYAIYYAILLTILQKANDTTQFIYFQF